VSAAIALDTSNGRLLAVVLAALIAALALGAGVLPAEAKPEPVGMRMVLRLHDLPPEYTRGGDIGCDVFTAEFETRRDVEEFDTRYHPVTCQYEYERRFLLPGQPPAPPRVASFAIGTKTLEGAAAGLAAGRDILASDLGEPHLREVPTQAEIGDETRLFRTRHAFAGGIPDQAGAAVLWRSGTTLAALYAAGLPAGEIDDVALALARAQQRHVLAPVPYTSAERYDAEVPMEDPRLQLPVYWLGPTFGPGSGRPASHLLDAFFPVVFGHPTRPVGVKELLSYEGISISAYTRSSWRRRLRTPAGWLVRDWRCPEATRVHVAGGPTARFNAGYRKDYAVCPRRPPNVVFAEVDEGRLVIGIDLPQCFTCIEAGRGPLRSVSAMKAIARALHLRERPPRLSRPTPPSG
jgi:hypothetical protein